MNELVELVKSIPGSFWGVVVGSVFALSGVFFTNQSNNRRLNKQFEYERKKRIEDSDLALRKEVYMQAAEAISRNLITLGNLSNLDIPYEQLSGEYGEKAPTIAKAQVIAREDSLERISTLSSEIAAVFLKLTLKRFPLMIAENNIEIINNQMEKHNQESDKFLDLMGQYNMAGTHDKRLWDYLQGSFDFNHGNFVKLLEKRDKSQKELFLSQVDFMEECINETTRLEGLIIPTIVSIREELNIPMDVKKYAEIVHKAKQSQARELEKFIEQSRLLVENFEQVSDE